LVDDLFFYEIPPHIPPLSLSLSLAIEPGGSPACLPRPLVVVEAGPPPQQRAVVVVEIDARGEREREKWEEDGCWE
jgi:hypothetical protein